MSVCGTLYGMREKLSGKSIEQILDTIGMDNKFIEVDTGVLTEPIRQTMYDSDLAEFVNSEFYDGVHFYIIRNYDDLIEVLSNGAGEERVDLFLEVLSELKEEICTYKTLVLMFDM